MSIKVFLTTPDIHGYQVDPPDTFQMNVNYTAYINEPVPAQENGSFNVNILAGSTPYAVYAEVYQRICLAMAAAQYPIPTKNDVFGYIPTPFSVLLPDLPTFA